MTARSIISSWSDERGEVACRFISPCVRNTGGSPTRRCRSEEAECTSFLSSSPSARSAPLYCVAAKSPGRPLGGAVTEVVSSGASTIGAAAMAEGFGGSGGGAGGGRAARRPCVPAGVVPDRRHHGRQPPHVGHDPHPHHAAVRDVLKLGL